MSPSRCVRPHTCAPYFNPARCIMAHQRISIYFHAWNRPGCCGFGAFCPLQDSTARRRRMNVSVDCLDRLVRAYQRAFLPAAPKSDLIARYHEALLRGRQDLGVTLEARIAFVRPGEALE